MNHPKYPIGSYVLLMDGCFWRFYEVRLDPWVSSSELIAVEVAKKTKRQSPMKPSWHKAERFFRTEVVYRVPAKFARASYATEEDVINAFDMMRSVHEAHGPSGEAVLDRLNLIIEMTRSDAPD